MKMFRVAMCGMVFAAASVGIPGADVAFGQTPQTSGGQTQQSSRTARASNDAAPSDKANVSAASKTGGTDTNAPAAGDQPVTEKQKKLAADTDKLLAMATALKQQVDKTNKDVLSVDVIKKAEEIEKLARSL
ncbi:MAG TPA: hypothetical protein VIX90_10265, partial [Edaphobacter sp.]